MKDSTATSERSPIQTRTIVVKSAKSRGTYVILGLLLGLLGIHNFYAGYFGRGVAQLILTALFGWIYVGIIITGIWVIIELFTVTKGPDGTAFE